MAFLWPKLELPDEHGRGLDDREPGRVEELVRVLIFLRAIRALHKG